MGPPPQLRAKPAKVAAEQVQCYQLQLAGKSIREIAKATGLGVATVHRRITDECTEIVTPLAEEVRARHLAQIAEWLSRINEQIATGYQVARNVEVGTRLLERQAKLMGIDAPEKIEATVIEITQEDIELAEAVREAQMQAATAEQRLREGSNG